MNTNECTERGRKIQIVQADRSVDVFIDKVLRIRLVLVLVFSERDRHTQAVEKHWASFKKGHADSLSPRGVQVTVPLISLIK